MGMRNFFRMERDGTRIEGGRSIRTFWNEQGRRFELDARQQRWREVPGIGPGQARRTGGTLWRVTANTPEARLGHIRRGRRPTGRVVHRDCRSTGASARDGG